MKQNRMRNNNNRFGKIIYSKSYYKNKIPSNTPSYNNRNIPNNYEDSTQRYDIIINKAKKTIEDYKKQLNDEDYFNNEIFYNNHIQNQLNKFNQGDSEYHYFSPYVSQNLFGKEQKNNNKGIRSNSAQKRGYSENNSFKDQLTNIKNQKTNFKKYFNDLYNDNNKNDNFNNINDFKDENEINKLRKKNIENEKIIIENSKEKISLIKRIKELENIINIKNQNNSIKNKNQRNNNNIVIINKKEKDEIKDNHMKELEGQIKEYTNLIEDQNRKIQLKIKIEKYNNCKKIMIF